MYNNIPLLSASPGVWPGGENRKPGEKPGRYRRCQRVMPRSWVKARHWGDLRRQSADGGTERLQRAKPEDLLKGDCTRAPGIGAERYDRI